MELTYVDPYRFMKHDRHTILVVADTDHTQDLLLDYLRGSGFKVILATDGETAVELACHAAPDIILLDVVLPGIDGFETCRRIKEERQSSNIPIIFITPQTSTVDKVRGFVLGAVDYIEKPIQSEEVLARVRTHLTLQQLQKEQAAQTMRLQAEVIEREKLIEELDSFAHTVAHDLKNPLGGVMSHAKFLRRYHTQMSPVEFLDSLDTIVRSSAKMNNIIEELLLLATIRTEEVQLAPVNMVPIIDDVIDRLSFLMAEYRAFVLPPDTTNWPMAYGYGPWIEEVWVNYISNAVKYGGRPPRIELGATPHSDGTVEFWVKDNGTGLTEAEQSQLFVPFNRLSQVQMEGHGLGLSIVYRIVKRLDGRVEVRSKNGNGSVFSFYLRQVE
jgi:two-component system sensor histidine kinase/response regulator